MCNNYKLMYTWIVYYSVLWIVGLILLSYEFVNLSGTYIIIINIASPLISVMKISKGEETYIIMII